MPDDHPPLTAVAAALRADTKARSLSETPGSSGETLDQRCARVALRALDTDPVREWAATVPCIRPDRDWATTCSNANRKHPECLLAALVPPESNFA